MYSQYKYRKQNTITICAAQQLSSGMVYKKKKTLNSPCRPEHGAPAEEVEWDIGDGASHDRRVWGYTKKKDRHAEPSMFVAV